MSKKKNRLDFRNLDDSKIRVLAAVLDHCDEMVEITDPVGRFLFVNKKFTEVTGFSLEETVGSTPKELLRTDSHAPEFFDSIWLTLATGAPWEGEFASRRKDGTEFRQLARIFPVVYKDEIEHMFAFKKVIDPEVESASLVAASVASREQELQAVRKHLRQVSEDLVASASMAVVGQLAAAIGHEINNPAQVLRSCLEHLEQRGDSLSKRDMQDVVGDALEAVRRLESVTSELLPFADVSSEGLSLVDVNDCIRRGLRVVHNELRHRAEVESELSALPLIEGMEGRLSRLFTSLFVSIVRRISEDCEGNRIFVKSSTDSESIRVDLRCEVSGTGEFFAELGERLRNWERDIASAGSQWISLILCQQIAVAHGGELRVEKAETGLGEICLLLPRRQIAEQEQRSRRRVLVVDDDELILRGLSRMLSEHYWVETCTSGKEALARIESTEYDAVVCDIMMPGMSGVALYEHLEASMPEVCPKFVFISAGTFTERTRKFADSTPQPVLNKPIRREELQATVDNLIVKVGIRKKRK